MPIITGDSTANTYISSSYIKIPKGNTAQRPVSSEIGALRFNTDSGQPESWNGTSWATSGGLMMQAVQSNNFTAVAGSSYPINTANGAITVTLPASPSAGQQIQIIDYAGTANTNFITINPNGKKINGSIDYVSSSINRESVTLIYVDSTQGWIDISNGSDAYISTRFAYAIEYLIVAGGGGGGNGNGSGGGGAGGLLNATASLGSVYNVVIGGGGAGGGSNSLGTNGSNSTISSFSAIGGGGGGNYGSNGLSGGSGGGGGGQIGYGAPHPGGSGTSGQGNAGGTGNSNIGGGGGGAGGAGGSSGVGGSGAASSITGSSIYRAGGGGGANDSGGGYGGGTGGGGGTRASGSSNTGGGGGAASYTYTSGNGGSGIAIIKVPTMFYTGIFTGSPTVTTSGLYTILTFTSSGSYTA